MKRGNCGLFLAGVVCGGMLFGGGAAWAAGVLAHPSTHRVTVDGIPVDVAAYTIQGNNYFKLRDIAALADFGVTWDGATSTVEIDTGARYVPEPPEDLYRVREEMVRRTNALRRAEGVAELALDADLMAAAQVRAEEAAGSLAYRHQLPERPALYRVHVRWGKPGHEGHRRPGGAGPAPGGLLGRLGRPPPEPAGPVLSGRGGGDRTGQIRDVLPRPAVRRRGLRHHRRRRPHSTGKINTTHHLGKRPAGRRGASCCKKEVL